MIDHEKARALLPRLMAGTLSENQETALLAHLKSCSDCSRRLESWQRLTGVLRERREPSLPPAAVARIAALARARRREVLEERRQLWPLVSMALFGWLLVLATLPLWQLAASGLRSLIGWPGSTGPAMAFLLGAILSYAFLPGLAPLLAGLRGGAHRED
jgi:predicted anti-sigma-YlaC factor YlaD